MRSVILLLCILAFSFAQAKQITEQKAYSIASRYFPSGIVSEGSLQMSSKQKKSSQGAEYFIFNQVDKSGYIIVSGDDQMPEVVGYSEHGAIDVENMPENMKNWLEGYAAYVREIRTATSVNVLRPIMSLGQPVVVPLVSTHWGQDNPFNKMAPEYSVGKHCPTGCAATALAQVMKFYAWPERGTGSHSYTSSKFGTISTDFSAHKYDWGNMLTDYFSYKDVNGNLVEEWNAKQADAVSLLMKDCGVALDMDYTQNSSGAVTSLILGSGPKYFNYNVKEVQRNTYSTAEYKSLMRGYLDNSHPLLYRGQGTGGGHAFVVDGYDSNDYFHINWGWDGMSDGYFDINYMNPSSLGTGGGAGGFVMSQAFYVLTPNRSSAPASSEYYLSYSGIYTNDKTASKGMYNRITINNQFYSGAEPADIHFGVGVYTEAKNLLFAQEYHKVNLSSGYGYSEFTNAYVDFSSISDGVYYLYPVYKVGNEREWHRNVGAIDYVKAVVSGSVVTFYDPVIDLVVEKSPTLESTQILLNRQMSLKIYISNKGNYGVSGKIVCGVREYGKTSDIGTFMIPAALFDNFAFESTMALPFQAPMFALGVEYELYVKHFIDEENKILAVSGTSNTLRFKFEQEYKVAVNALTYEDMGDGKFGLSIGADYFLQTQPVKIGVTYLTNPWQEVWQGYFAFVTFDSLGNQVAASDVFGSFSLEQNVTYGYTGFDNTNLNLSALKDGTYYLHMMTNRLVNGAATEWMKLAYDDYVKIIIKGGVVYVNEYSGVEEIADSKLKVTVSPNPATDFVEVRCGEVVHSIDVYAFDGRLVKTITSTNRFDVSDLQSGYYVLNIKTGSRTYKEKLIRR